MEQIEKIQGTEKEFIKVFQELCYSRSSWQVWADLMAAMACTLANSVDKTEPRYTAREKEYAECIKRLGGVEKPAKCFAIVVEALERNPDQDFLGKLYMSLELGNHWKGQFFTPYNVCECMARMKELPFTIVLELTLTEWPKGRHTSSLCAERKNPIHHISQWNITMVA